MTTTFTPTLQSTMNDANTNEVSDALRQMKIGTMLSPVKVTVTGLASATAIDITTAAVFAASTVTGLGTQAIALPPILDITALRVTAGAAAAGLRQIGDSGATASATVAKISDDGKTLTFEAGVTGFVLLYSPRSATDLQSTYSTEI